jgi:hypothetical protein
MNRPTVLFGMHLVDNFIENWKEIQIYMTSELFDASSTLFIEKQLRALLSLKMVYYDRCRENGTALKEVVFKSLNYRHLLSTSRVI